MSATISAGMRTNAKNPNDTIIAVPHSTAKKITLFLKMLRANCCRVNVIPLFCSPLTVQ